MSIPTPSEIERILSDPTKLEAYAALHLLSVESARRILERLRERPEVDTTTRNFTDSKARSEDFQGYRAGVQEGMRAGHDTGFAKGVALAALTVGAALLAIVAVTRTR